MKILILNWRDTKHPKSGGAEIVTLEHAAAWVGEGHAVDWLTASYGGAPSEEIIRGVKIIRKAGSLTIYFYVPFYLLRKGHLYDLIIDEAHGFPFFSPLFVKKPIIMFIHEIAGDIWDYMFSFPKNVIGKFLESWYFRIYRHSLFWTDAPSTIDELVDRGITRAQCVAIPCPIVTNSRILQNALKKKESTPTFIFVSRVVRMKGIEEVIKAFSFIVQSQPDARLWIVGGGEQSYIDELRRMIDEYHVNGHVNFFGQVSEQDKINLMSKAHILLHASVKEGWGLVVLEAAAVNTPSVVYNVPGLQDVVKHGQTGVIITENSPREMAKEALELYHDKKRYKQLQVHALRWARSLTWREETKKSLALLHRAVSTYGQ